MLPIPKSIIYLKKVSEIRKKCNVHYFFLKNWILFFILVLLFFLPNNTKKKSYTSVPEMLSFNPKIIIQKYPIVWCWFNFFIANVSDPYRYFTTDN
jgi:hypothetical protein